MNIQRVGFTEELDALALEYKRDYGLAQREMEFTDFVNNPFINCPVNILGLLSSEEVGDLPLIEIRIGDNDFTDTLLVTENTLQPIS